MEGLDEEQLREQRDGDGGKVTPEHGEREAGLSDGVARLLVHNLLSPAPHAPVSEENVKGRVDMRNEGMCVPNRVVRVVFTYFAPLADSCCETGELGCEGRSEPSVP